ncbi:MAG: MaoC family dehydratase [Microscillaceae bacterium]|nr:MaoC family dehydratase [Microscillaceae bacterium]
MLNQDQVHTHEFSFSQEEVIRFAEVSGDRNPVHLDAEYAARTVFKKPIIHGFLAGSIFSKVFGTLFPGEGTIYLKQTMEFLRPMFVDTVYEAIFKVKEIDTDKHKALVETIIRDKNTQKQTIKGEALIMHSEKIL